MWQILCSKRHFVIALADVSLSVTLWCVLVFFFLFSCIYFISFCVVKCWSNEPNKQFINVRRPYGICLTNVDADHVCAVQITHHFVWFRFAFCFVSFRITSCVLNFVHGCACVCVCERVCVWSMPIHVYMYTFQMDFIAFFMQLSQRRRQK